MLILAAFFLAGGTALRAQESGPEDGRSSVYWTQNQQAMQGFEENPPAIRRMVDALIKETTGKSTLEAAWKSLVDPGDLVGIKVATQGAPYFATKYSVVSSVIEGLVSAGVPRSRIVVWDRSAEDLRKAGFTGQRLGVRVVAAESSYLEEGIYTSAKLGRLIWGDRKFTGQKGGLLSEETNPDAFSSISHFPAVLEEVDKLINIPVMGDSMHVGISGALANVTISAIDNWRRFGKAPDFGAPDIPQMYVSEPLRGKVVLHIMDALVAQYAGGPFLEPNYCIDFDRIYMSRDPVALDAIALDLVESWRKEAKLPPVAEMSGHVEAAAAMGLGQNDMEKIERILVEQ